MKTTKRVGETIHFRAETTVRIVSAKGGKVILEFVGQARRIRLCMQCDAWVVDREKLDESEQTTHN